MVEAVDGDLVEVVIDNKDMDLGERAWCGVIVDSIIVLS